jgi:hypothetical protein
MCLSLIRSGRHPKKFVFENSHSRFLKSPYDFLNLYWDERNGCFGRHLHNQYVPIVTGSEPLGYRTTLSEPAGVRLYLISNFE